MTLCRSFLTAILIGISLAALGQPGRGSAIDVIDGIVYDTSSSESKLNRLIALSEQKEIKRYNDTLAFVLHEVAKVYWDLGKGEEGFATDKQALSLRKAYRHSDPENYCKSAVNLALDFSHFGERDSAIYYYTEVIRISPVNRQRSKSAYRIGAIYKQEGDFSLATGYANEALSFAQKDTLHPEIQDAFQLFLETFNLMLHQSDLRAADSIIYHIPRVQAYYHSLEHLKEDALLNYSVVLWYESNAYKFRKQYEKAEALLAQAENAYVASGMYDQVFDSERFNSRGILLRRLRRYDDALKALNKSLSMRIANKDSINIAVTHNNLGDLYLDKGDYENALKHYHASVKLLSGNSLSDDVTTLPSLDLLKRQHRVLDVFRYIGFKADAWRQSCKISGNESHCAEALKTYALADSLVDIVRAKHLMESSKLFWREDAKRLYSGAIDVARTMGNEAQALYFSDRSKAILVLDAVREHLMRNSMSRALMERKDSLEKLLMIMMKEPELQMQWATLNTMLDQVDAQMKEVIPAYSETDQMFSIQKIRRLQQELKENEAIIHYFDSPVPRNAFDAHDTLYAFVITKNTIRGAGLNEPAIIDALNAYHEANMAFLAKGIASERKPGSDPLYALLIQPLEPLPENITIVPDGAIAQIGFDGLRDSEGRYLIETKTIRYDFSLAMADVMSHTHSASTQVLAFAPMTEALCEQNLLTFTRNELKGIASHVSSSLFFGKDASKSRLFELAPQYGVVHLATHASANTLDPSQSWIALAGDTTSCDLLHVHDLYTEYLPASMVVVSACEGAHGVYASGEGAMSVARGFAYAGTASIVTSLWQVNDAATAEIMTSFYGYLAEGMTKSNALRQAKLDYIHAEGRKKMELHPAWWSAFIVIGNDVPLELERPAGMSWLYFVLVGIVALVVALIFVRKRHKG